MEKKQIVEIIKYIDNEFQKYGINYISQESYEIFYNIILIKIQNN